MGDRYVEWTLEDFSMQLAEGHTMMYNVDSISGIVFVPGHPLAESAYTAFLQRVRRASPSPTRIKMRRLDLDDPRMPADFRGTIREIYSNDLLKHYLDYGDDEVDPVQTSKPPSHARTSLT